MSIDLGQYGAVLLDLDGTVYHEEVALPGAIELIRHLQKEGICFACLSNSTTSPQRIAARLQDMGVKVDPERIYSAAAAAADYVLERFGRRPGVFNLATEGVQDMLEGLVQWVETEEQPCAAVIVGHLNGAYVTEQRQRVALMLVRRGAALVGICADRVYPSPRGLEFGSGAHTTMLGYAAGVQAVFVGKPEPLFFRKLCQKLGVQAHSCILIGDNIESDVVGAKALGMKTILVLTGVVGRGDLGGILPEHQPDIVLEDLRQLF